MSADHLSAVVSIVTAIVIAATATAAMIQLRHMRAANTLSAMLALRTTFNEPEFLKASLLVHGGPLREALTDTEFCKVFESGETRLHASQEHQALYQSLTLVLNWYEAFGSVVVQRVVSMRDVGDSYAAIVDTVWSQAEPAIALLRRIRNDDAYYEMFEAFTVLCRRWLHDHPTSYPTNLPRILPPTK